MSLCGCSLSQLGVDEKLVILADEVYQANIWKKGASFSSFKKVNPLAKQIQACVLRPRVATVFVLLYYL